MDIQVHTGLDRQDYVHTNILKVAKSEKAISVFVSFSRKKRQNHCPSTFSYITLVKKLTDYDFGFFYHEVGPKMKNIFSEI